MFAQALHEMKQDHLSYVTNLRNLRVAYNIESAHLSPENHAKIPNDFIKKALELMDVYIHTMHGKTSIFAAMNELEIKRECTIMNLTFSTVHTAVDLSFFMNLMSILPTSLTTMFFNSLSDNQKTHLQELTNQLFSEEKLFDCESNVLGDIVSLLMIKSARETALSAIEVSQR